MKTTRTSAPASADSEAEPAALTIRITMDLRELRTVPRLRALARSAGASESQISRALLLLGLAQAERDPGALARAADLARGGG